MKNGSLPKAALASFLALILISCSRPPSDRPTLTETAEAAGAAAAQRASIDIGMLPAECYRPMPEVLPNRTQAEAHVGGDVGLVMQSLKQSKDDEAASKFRCSASHDATRAEYLKGAQE